MRVEITRFRLSSLDEVTFTRQLRLKVHIVCNVGCSLNRLLAKLHAKKRQSKASGALDMIDQTMRLTNLLLVSAFQRAAEPQASTHIHLNLS